MSTGDHPPGSPEWKREWEREMAASKRVTNSDALIRVNRALGGRVGSMNLEQFRYAVLDVDADPEQAEVMSRVKESFNGVLGTVGPDEAAAAFQRILASYDDEER